MNSQKFSSTVRVWFEQIGLTVVWQHKQLLIGAWKYLT